MFEGLIRRGLPSRTQALYAQAKIQQPQDCQGPVCPHHQKISESQREWMHQLRRELYLLAFSDGKRNGLWHLK
jgi:hypothetical protein